MAMAEDVPALEAIKPGGKTHPIDKVLHDGESVTLGGTTLVAPDAGAHSGCTTWTTKVREGGKAYDVVIGCSLRPLGMLTPAIVDELNRSFALVRSLPCDVPLGDHPAQYGMREKYARLSNKGSNPFIDRAGCFEKADIEEAMFHALMDEQRIAQQFQ
jgi:metallo-beta-lactamase class B